MLIEQIYTGCLAQGAYYIESNREAVVIDPLRETTPYLQRAARSGARIKYILETHFHADFVSGHLDLSKKTGATIVYGPQAQASFEFKTAVDGEELQVGHCTIKVLHTPGHTMESTCYLLKDEKGHDRALFTGDTLFIGDVGRPDLAQKIDATLTPEKLAGYLYDSLQNKIMPLRDDILIYPGHGAGSACGKHLSEQRYDSLGNQKRHNYALKKELSKEDFITAVTRGLTPPPGYFPMNVMMNKQGYESLDKVLDRGQKAMTPEDFEAVANKTGALVLDTREAPSFAEEFIPNSINIGIDGNFAPWAGALIPDLNQPILVVSQKGREEEVITRLARVGLDHSLGYLDGGIEAWKASGRPTAKITSISAKELAVIMSIAPIHILDVRKASEFAEGHVLNAINIPLDHINENMHRLDKDKTYYVYCAGGYRSMMFNSILRARGFNHLIDIHGGYKAIRDAEEISITNYTA
ncbi:MAG: MBL fold metallo-hydrolase [Chitinophagaceae bacterium]|nr:MBL fold metallo-hydrolase [Chitinophagaceae bacterium]